MADKAVVTQTTLDAIGQAIIAKGGATAPMTPAQMPEAIAAIPSGGGGGYTLVLNVPRRDRQEEDGPLHIEYFDGTSENRNLLCSSRDPHNQTVVFRNVKSVASTGLSDGMYNHRRLINSNGDIVSENGTVFTLTQDCALSFVLYTACFSPGTMIHLANGRLKPVEEIGYADDLLVYDFDEGRISHAKPLWIKEGQISDYWTRDVFDDGRELHTHHGHSVFNMDRSKFVHDTDSVGCRVFTIDGKNPRLVSSEPNHGFCKNFNVMTRGHVNLFANGILTSSRLNNMYPIRDMKFVKDGAVLVPRSAFAGLPDDYIDGLRLCEQTMAKPDDTAEYVRRMLAMEARR